jgi:membrane-associated protein
VTRIDEKNAVTEPIGQILELFLHLDRHLSEVLQTHGPWVYALLFLIIFVETGLVVMPFLPGDSLLFVAGALAGAGGMNLPLLIGLLFCAAVAGDALNYAVGRRLGLRVNTWEQSRWFNRQAFERTQQFYERHGPITIVVARFIPFVRTFAPFVAGLAGMRYAQFVSYNVIGAGLWVGGLTTLGWWFGDQAWVKQHFSAIALAMIIIPGLPAVWEIARHWMAARKIASTPMTKSR